MKTARRPADPVEQAATEAAEADALLAALEERVRDGDDTVTPDQLASTRELGRFAKLRAEAARRKADRAAAAEAERERAATIAQAVTLVAEQANPAKVAAAYETARTALVALLTATTTHDDAIREAAALLRKVGAPAIRRHVASPTGGEWEHAPASVTAPTVEHQQGNGALSIETGRAVSAVGTGPLLVTLLDQVAREHDVRMPTGQPEFTRAALAEHVNRNGDTVRRILARAEASNAA
ncbi:hypothetical protein [Streptomyces sp. NPDC054771]